jgi:hypothetical protein
MSFLWLADLTPLRKEVDLFLTVNSQGGSEQSISDEESIVGIYVGI